MVICKEKTMSSRKTVGLALGSGSSSGWAHIGAIEALEEENIPNDLRSKINSADFPTGSVSLIICGFSANVFSDFQITHQFIDKEEI